jgi:hypothetical protein
MPKIVPTGNEMRSEADILVQVPKLSVMDNDKVSAQSLISWLRKTRKCEKSDFGELKVQLEVTPAPERIAGKWWYGYGL